MNEATKGLMRSTSMPLPDGGDTHVHAWENGRGFTVTTRLPGGFSDHQSFRVKNMEHTPADPSVLGRMPW